ncbi:transcription factor IIA, alpha/beta subunit-domain-containing protein [Mycena rosella]|uniref:Transcription initiation factor IIA large subunit n=1 Tax=Mycena rosella TaxID=1033263 RepID=A0AAD7E1G9_MYCRO|nr:transcription factor IIA, alpha/beta subunit-domain-containing protein [Mycena rosella]
MSNKIVPSIYRNVIDDVMSSIKHDFEEYGVAEDVLAELQHKWEDKVIASRVAEFEPTNPTPQFPHGIQMPQYTSVHPYVPPAQASQSQVKSEPVDSRYPLNAAPYTLPPLLGPKIIGRPNPGGQTSVLSFPPGPPQGRGPIPQVDGPSEDSDDSTTPPPASYAPRTSHPSLPQPQASSSTAPADSEAINSDLDDSDTEDEDLEDGAGANSEIVFCTYEKVTRVKTKWKCVLKDGMVHANGKDYLFSRCTGEFEFEI